MVGGGVAGAIFTDPSRSCRTAFTPRCDNGVAALLTFIAALVVAVVVRGPGAVVGVVLLAAVFVPLERLVALRRPLDHPDEGVERPVRSGES